MLKKTKILIRKIYWKFRWKFLNSPILYKQWHHGFTIILPWSGSAAQIFHRRYSEPEVAAWIENNLQQGDLFVDVGAHIGEYCLIAAANILPNGQIIALEPQEDLCEVITRNFQINHLANFRVVHGALGAKPGTCKILSDPKTKGALLTSEDKGNSIDLFDLPTLLGNKSHEGITWVKIDAAGFEAQCLAASKDFISANSIHLILKAYNQREITNRFPDYHQSVADIMDSIGYRCYVCHNGILVEWNRVVIGYGMTIISLPGSSEFNPSLQNRL